MKNYKKVIIVSILFLMTSISGCSDKKVGENDIIETSTFAEEYIEDQELNIVGKWDGVAIFVNDELTMVDKGVIVATISDDNTFEFMVNDTSLSGVWVEINSDEIGEEKEVYNFITYKAEEVGKGILSNQPPFVKKESEHQLSFAFDEGELWVQFER